MPPRTPTEFEIQRALCLWLDGDPEQNRLPALRSDVIYFHTPNGGARSGVEGKRFKEIGVKAGIFDLTFLDRSRFFVLEIKDATGQLSPAQFTMWPRYVTAGAAGIAVVNNLADAKTQIHAWNLVDSTQLRA